MWALVHWPIIHLRYLLPVFVIGPWCVFPPDEWVEGASPEEPTGLAESSDLSISAISLIMSRAEEHEIPGIVIRRLPSALLPALPRVVIGAARLSLISP